MSIILLVLKLQKRFCCSLIYKWSHQCSSLLGNVYCRRCVVHLISLVSLEQCFLTCEFPLLLVFKFVSSVIIFYKFYFKITRSFSKYSINIQVFFMCLQQFSYFSLKYSVKSIQSLSFSSKFFY